MGCEEETVKVVVIMRRDIPGDARGQGCVAGVMLQVVCAVLKDVFESVRERASHLDVSKRRDVGVVD